MSLSSIFQRILQGVRCDRVSLIPDVGHASRGSIEVASTDRTKIDWIKEGLIWIKDVLIEAWPSAVFIAALVGIVHSHFHWLDGIDGYAFGVVSTVSQKAKPSVNARGFEHDTDPRVWLFSIDEKMFETRYFGRTPLDRCQLARDLASIYERVRRHNIATGSDPANRIGVMVVDLDLSPVISKGESDPQTASEKACQRQLDDVLRKNGSAGAKGGDAIRTIAMTPFDADSNGVGSRWQESMRSAVSFGDPDLRIEHGMAFRYACDPASLAAMAYRATRVARNGCIEHAMEERDIDEVRYQPIDPHTYLEQIDLVEWGDGTPKTRTQSDEAQQEDPRVRAAFFGVAFGADQFLTPVGKLSGVEVHAGSYLSLLDPVTSSAEWKALALDVALGLIFGLLIKYFWTRFFNDSTHGSETNRTFAARSLVYLGAAFILVSLGLVYASSQLFHFRAWISPLPMAIGMLFDGMVLAPVDHALESKHRKTFCQSVRNIFGHEAYAFIETGHKVAGLGKLFFVLSWWVVLLVSLLME